MTYSTFMYILFVFETLHFPLTPKLRMESIYAQISLIGSEFAEYLNIENRPVKVLTT